LDLSEHVKPSRLKEDEDRERAAYAAMPEGDEMTGFEKVTVWGSRA